MIYIKQQTEKGKLNPYKNQKKKAKKGEWL